MNEIKKVVRVGTMPRGWGKKPDYPLNIFAKIAFRDGRLSISGAIDPRPSGNCGGSCGQFIISFKEYDHRGHASISTIKPAPGWNRAAVRMFFDIWDRWHLNDMKAEDVPADALHFLASLPDTDKTPAWV